MAESDIKRRIALTLAQVAEAKELDHDHRDALSDMLVSAESAANGTPDKIEAIARATANIAIVISRGELRGPHVLATALENHTLACPMRAPTVGRLAALYPFRWPLAVIVAAAVFSPFVGPAIAKVVQEKAAVERVQHYVEGRAEK